MLGVKWWTKVQLSGTREQGGDPFLKSDTMEFKLKLIRRDKEGQFILVEETVNQDDTTILSIHAPNSGAPNHIKKKKKDVLLYLKT